MYELSGFCFDREGNAYVAVFQTHLSISFNKKVFKKPVKYLLGHCFLNLVQEYTIRLWEFLWDQTLHHLWLTCSSLTTRICGFGKKEKSPHNR